MFTYNKYKWYPLLFTIMLMPSRNIFAQQKNYSLQNLVDAVNNYLPILKQKKALIDVANATIKDTKHSFLPQLKFNEQIDIGSANSLAGSYFTFGTIPSTSGGIRNSNNLNAVTGNESVIYGEYELCNFGYKNAKINYARANVNLAESDLQKEQYLLDITISKLYLTILRNQYKLNADKQNIERYKSIYSVIRALTLSGIKPGSDSSLAQAELSKTKITYNQTLGVITQLKEQLAYLTGVPINVLNIDTLKIQPLESLPNFPSHQIDSNNHPLIKYYVNRNELFSSNERVIRRSFLPKIILAGGSWARGSSIQYNDQYESLNTGLSYQRFNYVFGLAFSYNLLNSIYKKDKLSINHFQWEASKYELEQQNLALQSSLKQANDALQITETNLLELPVQLQAATLTYQQKLAQYKAGLISLIDLTNASFVLYRSQTDYIETINDWYLSSLDKAAATGNLYEFIKNIK